VVNFWKANIPWRIKFSRIKRTLRTIFPQSDFRRGVRFQNDPLLIFLSSVVSGKILANQSVIKTGKSPFLIKAWRLIAFSLAHMGGEGRVRGGGSLGSHPSTNPLPSKGRGNFCWHKVQTAV
jgi:hypothetical protein